VGSGPAARTRDYMFKKILIANRGEIALRIIHACRELGIKTVAVFSEADENSLHVRFADEDVCIGPPRSADSYLNVPAIISAAEITGADAIHPGYGFLSESAYLAEVCEACHIRFIGPDPSVIKLLGDKARAKKAMKKAGVPMLPGSDGPVTDEEQALKVVKEIGLPVIVKAVAGGGGRGMRVVRTAGELSHALRTAQREAEAAFGNGDVYIEKYLESPRHIEFQIIGDHHGNVVHLGERECSIQRRHQKLIEEAPSPALSDKIRKKMGGIVVDAAKAVQYTNAGTFEFLMDRDGKFYYMETNTRLQVEHPVTEMVTGIDIVKEQIRIAAGERLSFKQSEVTFTGHAIECRVNAEDPDTFAPSPGVIHAFSTPGGPGVRVDTFVHSECTVTPYYDSMIAKIITHGRDRQEAIARMKRTLDMTVIEGIRTSVPLHQRILNEADFHAGRLSTSFMDRFMPQPKKATLADTA
jgi:acetyl-CoA carboxylase biotin carboxylase subunit